MFNLKRFGKLRIRKRQAYLFKGFTPSRLEGLLLEAVSLAYAGSTATASIDTLSTWQTNLQAEIPVQRLAMSVFNTAIGPAKYTGTQITRAKRKHNTQLSMVVCKKKQEDRRPSG